MLHLETNQKLPFSKIYILKGYESTLSLLQTFPIHTREIDKEFYQIGGRNSR